MQDLAARLIDISDDAYAGLSDEALTELSSSLSKLSAEHVPAPQDAASADLPPLLVLAAPDRVPIEEIHAWPFLVGYRESGLRAWQVDWRQNARLVLVDLRDGHVTTKLLKTSKKRKAEPTPSMGSARPDDLDAATVRVGVTKHTPFESGWPGATAAQGHYAATVVAFDWHSNTEVTELLPPEGDSNARPAPGRPTAATSIEPLDGSQTPPEDSAIVAPSEMDPSGPLRVDIALQFAVRDAPLIPPDEDTGGPALTSVTLMLLKRDQAIPLLVSLWVPVTLVGPGGPEQRASAHFAVDLAEQSDLTELRGAHLLYAFVGRHTLGPERVVIGQLEGVEALLGR